MAWAVLAVPAGAADRIYWANSGGNKISYANLDGSGGGDLNTSGATMNGPSGVTIYPGAGRIYWANRNANKISFARLGGGGDFNTGGVTVSAPTGVTLYHALGGAGHPQPFEQIYWANFGANKISCANLDGSGGCTTWFGDTSGATVSGPQGVAFDLVGGKFWWANSSGKISFASVYGGGGGDLNTSGATINNPYGLAIDRDTDLPFPHFDPGRIYWANFGANKISHARLLGGGGGDLNTSGATVSSPVGVAIDHRAGKIYWANYGANKISYASLSGGGGGDLNTSGATVNKPEFPALLRAPHSNGPPVISQNVVGYVGPFTGSTLGCHSQGWRGDQFESFLYHAPLGSAYRWSLDSAPIAGATGGALVASRPGDYRCTDTASNQAGSTSLTSAPYHVSEAPYFIAGAPTRVTLRLAVRRIPAREPLKVRVANANGFKISCRLSGQTVNRVSVSRKRRIKLRAKSFRVATHAKKTVKLRLPRVLRKLLKRKGRLKLRLTAKVKDPRGHTRTVRKRVAPKLKKKRRSR